MNNLKKNLGVFALTVLLIVIGAELYYRFLNPKVLGNTGSLSYAKWSQNNVQLNSWGFRDKERAIKKANPDINPNLGVITPHQDISPP